MKVLRNLIPIRKEFKTWSPEHLLNSVRYMEVTMNTCSEVVLASQGVPQKFISWDTILDLAQVNS